MSNDRMEDEIVQHLHGLSPIELRRVLEFVRSVKTTPVMGKSGNEMLDLVGVIPPSDMKEMMDAIEAGCERIDANGW